MPYEKIEFKNGQAPGISAERLNHIQTQHDEVFSDIQSKGFNMGDFLVIHNPRDNTIDFEFPGAGIKYTKEDTAFNGTHASTEVVTGGLVLQKYPTWNDADLDETRTVDETITYAEADGAELFLEDLFALLSELKYHNEDGIFVSNSIDVRKIGRIHSNLVSWVEQLPVGTSTKVEFAVSTDNGSTFGSYQTMTNGGSINSLSNGFDLSNARIRYRITLNTTDLDATPTMEKVITELTSRQMMKLTSGGQLQLKADTVPNVSGTF